MSGDPCDVGQADRRVPSQATPLPRGCAKALLYAVVGLATAYVLLLIYFGWLVHC
ncbi:MAG TPA: hypothetical protein VF796_14775 [Humisphaera sp.]